MATTCVARGQTLLRADLAVCGWRRCQAPVVQCNDHHRPGRPEFASRGQVCPLRARWTGHRRCLTGTQGSQRDRSPAVAQVSLVPRLIPKLVVQARFPSLAPCARTGREDCGQPGQSPGLAWSIRLLPPCGTLKNVVAVTADPAPLLTTFCSSSECSTKTCPAV